MVMFGKEVLPVLGELNSHFGGEKPKVGPRELKFFGPDEDLGRALASVMDLDDKELKNLLAAYISAMPRSHQVALRSIIHYALSSKPQVLLNFSWAPAYDFEMTIWEMVEPEPFHSGITIALRGRYPDHGTRYAATASPSP
jgi:hypothetical protein